MNRSLLTVVAASVVALLGACANTTTVEPDIAMDPVATTAPNTYSYAVRGMACENCAGHLKEEIAKVPGVKSVDIDFASKRAVVTVDPSSPPASDEVRHAGMAWMYHHMGLEYDPDCLDPENRERIRKGG